MRPNRHQSAVYWLNRATIVQHWACVAAIGVRRVTLQVSELVHLRSVALDWIQEDEPVDNLAQRWRSERTLVGCVLPPVGCIEMVTKVDTRVR